MTPFTVSTTGYPAPNLRAAGLPAGITMVDNHNGTATISGTPRSLVAETYPVTMTASSKAGIVTQHFTLTVGPG